MRFAGVFVGVGAQEFSAIPALKFAARDARALWAVFADANEGAGASVDALALLTNKDATRSNVLEALSALVLRSTQDQFDVAMVHFSGHGTHNGELILYDTDPDSLAGSAVEIGEVTRALAGLRAGNLIVTFDCCFAGMVLGMSGSSNADAFLAAMEALSGESRAIVWAAGPSQPARESSIIQHGYFTYGLLDGLRNPATYGRPVIGLSEWLEGAMRFVVDQTSRRGLPQQPGGRLSLGPSQTLPSISAGRHQRELEQDAGILPVTKVTELDVVNFPSNVIRALQSRLGPGADLNRLQCDAICPAGLIAGKNVVARAPTSSGKTVVGELAVLRQYLLSRKAVVLLPTRALVGEQAAALEERYGTIGLRVVRSTGEAVDDDSLLFGQHFDVAVLTYEKFAALITAKPSLLDAVGTVVVDEVQTIQDRERGRTVELILTRLLRWRGAGHALQIVALCADVGSLNRLQEWLTAMAIGEGVRPVPLFEGVVAPSGLYRWLDREAGQGHTEQLAACIASTTGLPERDREAQMRARVAVGLIGSLLSEGHQVLAFRTSKPKARSLAKLLADSLGLPSVGVGDQIRAHPASRDLSRAGRKLLYCLDRGVGLHSADLDSHEREVVESAFRRGELKVLISTTTLAMGINTPASAVVIVDQAFWSPAAGETWMGVTEYRNMAGRAGRWLPGATEGRSFLIAENNAVAEELWSRFVASPGDILQSALGNLADDDLVIALMGLVDRGTARDLVSAAAETFSGYHAEDKTEWRVAMRARVEAALRHLAAEDFVHLADDGKYELSSSGRVCSAFGLIVNSAIRVLKTARALIVAGATIGEGELVALTQLTEELDRAYTPMERGEEEQWDPRRDNWLSNRPALSHGLCEVPGSDGQRVVAGRLKRLLGLRMWVGGETIEAIEGFFVANVEGPAMGEVRSIASRTSDLVVPVAHLVGTLLEDGRRRLIDAAAGLVPRLELGVSTTAARLHRLGLGLTRWQATELANAGILGQADLVRALSDQRTQLEPILSSEGVAALRVAFERRQARRGRNTSESSVVLSLFDREEF